MPTHDSNLLPQEPSVLVPSLRSLPGWEKWRVVLRIAFITDLNLFRCSLSNRDSYKLRGISIYIARDPQAIAEDCRCKQNYAHKYTEMKAFGALESLADLIK